jgi:hypothetical protein
MSHKNQSGFILMAVTIIVTIGLLGLVGWSLYSHYYSSQNSATTGSQSPKPTISNPSAATPQPKYLDIKELGVKITLSSQISDAVYAPFEAPQTDGSTVIGISAQSLIAKDATCAASRGILGLIRASTIAPTYIGGTLPVDNKSVFMFGDTYYQYISPQSAGCFTTTQADSGLISSKLSAFRQAFTTLQPDSNILDIKELGINIKLDDSIKDAIYTTGTDAAGSQFAYISTQTLTTISNGTCSPAKGSFASITKASGTPEQVFLRPTAPVDNVKTFLFGSDTYVFIGGTGATCSQDPTVQHLSNQQESTFINDFKTVQLDN